MNEGKIIQVIGPALKNKNVKIKVQNSIEIIF